MVNNNNIIKFEDWPRVYWAMNRGLGIQGLSTDTILICTGNNEETSSKHKLSAL